MGIKKPTEEYEMGVLASLGWKYKGLKWCEFGNQRSYRKHPAKEIYEKWGVSHVSMDLNGKYGALRIDLGRPVPSVYVGQFDVVTNYGTIEHINNQFEAFKNMHDMCKENGIMIHIFPLVGNWPEHGRYYYSQEFVEKLASICGYRTIEHVILDKLCHQGDRNVIAVTYMKKGSSGFPAEEEFKRIEGVIDSGNRGKTENYTMKFLVATRADENVKRMTDLTHPIMREFAKRWDADFLVLDHDADCDIPMGRIHHRIMDFYDLLGEYDIIVQLDSDTVINKNCPNLFGLVPYDEIGTIFEDKGSRLKNRRERILSVQKAWGDIGWDKGYINTGVFIVSRVHREIFRKFDNRYWTQKGFDDVHLGYQIHRLGFKITELPFQYNHMAMFSEPWNGNPSRFDSYIIHYAGRANFPDRRTRTRIELIRDDIKEIYGV